MRKPATVAVVLALTAAACAGGSDRAGDGGSRRATPVTVHQIVASPKEPGPSALRAPDDPALPPPLVDLAEVISGGPPPDGIPPIDKPAFQRARDVDWIAANEPVLAFELDGEARAYPVQIMTWHEIVNDTVGDVPVAITYCPLCNSAIAFDRRSEGRVLDFGTSGRLYRSALVMYDRQTESLWTHYTGQAIAGRLTGLTLQALPVSTVSWSDFRAAHPAGLVLSRNTGFDRRYGSNPYPGYDDASTSPFLFEGEVDGRLTAKTRVVGIETGGKSAAVPLTVLRDKRVVTVKIASRSLVVWWKRGTTSALDADSVAAGKDVGATGVFDPALDGRSLTFRASGADFVDKQTDSRWNVFGRATGGPLAGRQLKAVAHVDTFWFAWAAYRPDTTVITRNAV